LPLNLRMKIAVKIAEALEFLHSPETGVIGHGRVTTSNILLDDNFVPKLTDFSVSWKLIKEGEATGGNSIIGGSLLEKILHDDPAHYGSVLLNMEREVYNVGGSLLEKILHDDPARYGSVLMNMERDVYNYGGTLLALITQERNIDQKDLIAKFTKAYEKDRSGKALFDKSITAEEDIRLLEEIGRLALKCTILNVQEIHNRPTMKEVAEQLHMLQRSWKGRTTKLATQVIGAAPVVSSTQTRLPNQMRHLYGYRRISADDPVHA
jgi:serine/threonine protein kinase